MKKTTGHKTTGLTVPRALNSKSKKRFSVLAVASGALTLAGGGVQALELGELQINSSLGQPFKATIPYALNANEQLFDFCIFLRPGNAGNAVPTISRPKVSVADGLIVLTGTKPILEPVLAMQVVVDCPYTANLAREYTLMMSPMSLEARPGSQFARTTSTQGATAAAVRSNQQVPVAAQPTQSKPTPRLPAQDAEVQPARSSVAGEPIENNSRYFVQSGDTLSSIARRINNRSGGVWPAARRIHAGNPDAFVNGDINQLIAAVWLTIPDLSVPGSGTSQQVQAAAQTADANNAAPVADESAIENAASGSSQTIDFVDEVVIPPITDYVAPTMQDSAADAATSEPATPVAAAAPEPDSTGIDASDTTAAASAAMDTAADIALADNSIDADTAGFDTNAQQDAALDDTAVLRPGDVVADNAAGSGNADVNPAGTATGRVTPVVTRPAASTSSALPAWIFYAGGILAVLIGVFAFRRPLSEKLASLRTPAGASAEPAQLDENDLTVEATIVDDVDFQFDDNTINSQALSLDADFDDGTGLGGSGELDVAQDFNFTAENSENDAEMDLELPAETAQEPESSPTDIIGPSHRAEEAIVAEETFPEEDTRAAAVVDSEVQPDAETDSDYDLSMIVDATRQPVVAEEVTAMDLMAVPIDETDDESDFGGQTLASDAEIAILEQDYEDEFTQTQALNEEIARAAEELAVRMHEEDSAEVTSRLEHVDDPAMTATVEAAHAGNEDLTEIADPDNASLDIADLELTEIADLDETEVENFDLTEFVDPERTEIADLDLTELSDLEDTGVNPQLTAKIRNQGNDATVEMPRQGSDPTVEMANPGNDATVEVPVESNQSGDKGSKAS